MSDPNAEQLEAIQADYGPVRVLAGPGSGKTFTIGQRYVRMVAEGISPTTILAVTFNKRMADELLSRILKLIPDLHPDAQRQISTIHAFCLRILRAYYKEYPKEVAPVWFIKSILQQALEGTFPEVEHRPAWEETYDWINTSKFYGYDTDSCTAFFQKVMGRGLGWDIARIRQAFDINLREKDYVTFPDMPLDMEIALSKDPVFKSYCQSRIQHVILDEGQDTTAQAMRILTELVDHTNSFFIVGDTDQLLYRFAGATPEENLFDGFEKRFPAGHLCKLSVNYRSTRQIVDSSRRVITYNYEVHSGPYPGIYFKDLRPHDGAPGGTPVEVTTYRNPIEESQGIVDQISHLIDMGDYRPGDFYVGFRTRAQAGYMESAFSRSNLPYVNTTGMSFWSLGHIQDVLGYLRLAVNPDDKQAFARVFNIPSRNFVVPWRTHPEYNNYISHRFLGRSFLDATGSICGGPKLTILRRMLNEGKFKPGASDMIDLVNEIRNSLYAEGIPAAIQTILDECYKRYIEYETGSSAEAVGEGGKIDDLATVIEMAGEFADVETFLHHVDRLIEAARASEKDDWDGRIVLSTIHRLKGLERPVVFGAGICEYDPEVSHNPVAGLLPHTYSMVEPPNMGHLPTGAKGRIEDERCLFYVLITRAKELVYLSSLERYRRIFMQPSRFIQEMREQGDQWWKENEN